MEELINNLDFEEMDYYYHITSKGYGNEIIENGLYMQEKSLKSTAIKITKEILDDFERYCESEYKTGLSNRQEMVIIGCAKGDGRYLVLECEEPIITESGKFDYFISTENILGYIDLESLNVIYNPEYIHNYRL